MAELLKMADDALRDAADEQQQTSETDEKDVAGCSDVDSDDDDLWTVGLRSGKRKESDALLPSSQDTEETSKAPESVHGSVCGSPERAADKALAKGSKREGESSESPEPKRTKTAAPKSGRKLRNEAKERLRLEDIERLGNECRTTDLFWALGYYGTKSVWFPALRVNNIAGLSLSDQDILKTTLAADKRPIADVRGDSTVLVIFDEGRMYYQRNLIADLVPFVPDSEAYNEMLGLTVAAKKPKGKRRKSGSASLSKKDRSLMARRNAVVATYRDLYNKASERERAEQESMCLVPAAEIEKLLQEDPRDDQAAAAPKRRQLELNNKVALVVNPGDVLLVRDGISKLLLRVVACTVDSSDVDFPISLDNMVSGKPYLMVNQIIERVIPGEEAMRLLGDKFDSQVEYLTPQLPLSSFERVDGSLGVSANSRLQAETTAVKKVLREKFGDDVVAE